MSLNLWVNYSRISHFLKISKAFKSQLMVWRQERMQHWLWGEEESLWHVKEVKYLGVLFMSAEKVEREIDRQTGAQSPVVRKPYWADVVHSHTRQKANSSIYQYCNWWPRNRCGWGVHGRSSAVKGYHQCQMWKIGSYWLCYFNKTEDRHSKS